MKYGWDLYPPPTLKDCVIRLLTFSFYNLSQRFLKKVYILIKHHNWNNYCFSSTMSKCCCTLLNNCKTKLVHCLVRGLIHEILIHFNFNFIEYVKDLLENVLGLNSPQAGGEVFEKYLCLYSPWLNVILKS